MEKRFVLVRKGKGGGSCLLDKKEGNLMDSADQRDRVVVSSMQLVRSSPSVGPGNLNVILRLKVWPAPFLAG
jgi:hypothetical protein